jgi:N-acetylglucosaminyl-diphospho-decaprenol L-rhamnosyltransferase
MADPSPLVSLVAVNYDGAALIERFLASVRASDYESFEVIVVDNASGDGSADIYAANEDVRVIRSDVNLGFGRGCNLGAANARGQLLLFMNPDVELSTDTISVLVRDMLATPAAAIVCATTVVEGFRHERRRYVEDVAAMAGAAMLVERSHFEALGGFDPWIFLYSEDTELCYRTWLAGKRVLKDWDAVAAHDTGGTGGGRAWSAEQIKNGLYIHLKLRGWKATVRYAGRMVLKTLLRGARLRDPAVLSAWTDNARELRATLAKRRAVLASATPSDRARLERLGAEHAYWARRNWRRSLKLAIARRIRGLA